MIGLNSVSPRSTLSLSIFLVIKLCSESVSALDLDPLKCYVCNTGLTKEVSEAACRNPKEHPEFEPQLCSYSLIRNISDQWSISSSAKSYTQVVVEEYNVFICRKQVRPVPDGSGKPSILRFCEYESKYSVEEYNMIFYQKAGVSDNVCIPAGGSPNTGEKPDQTVCFCSKDGCNAGSALSPTIMVSRWTSALVILYVKMKLYS